MGNDSGEIKLTLVVDGSGNAKIVEASKNVDNLGQSGQKAGAAISQAGKEGQEALGGITGKAIEAAKSIMGIGTGAEGAAVGLKTMQSAALGLGAALGGALAILGGGMLFKSAIDSMSEFVGDAKKMSVALGVNINDAAAFNYAYQRVGVSTESVAMALKGFERQLKTNQGTIVDHNGAVLLQVKAGESVKDAWFRAIEVIKKAPEGFGQTQTAMELVGSRVKDLNALLKVNQDDVGSAADFLSSLGMTIDKDLVAQLRAFKSGMVDAQTVLTALEFQIAKEVLPTLTKLGKWFSGEGPYAVQLTIGAFRNVEGALIAFKVDYEVAMEYIATACRVAAVQVVSAMKTMQAALNLDFSGVIAAVTAGVNQTVKVAQDGLNKVNAIKQKGLQQVEDLYDPDGKKRFGGYEEHENLKFQWEKDKPAPKYDFGGGGGGGGKGGGGGGGHDTEKQFQSLMDTLEKELARETKNGAQIIDAWYQDIIKKVKEYAVGEGQIKEGIAAADKVRDEKKRNLETQFTTWKVKETGDTLKAIDLEEEAQVKKYGQRSEIKEIYDRKRAEETLNRAAQEGKTQEGLLQAALKLTTDYEEQRTIQLAINAEVAKTAMLELEREHTAKKITDHLYEQRKLLIESQKKVADRDATTRTPSGAREGAVDWARNRPQAGARAATDTKKMLDDFEKQGATALGNMIKGIWSGSKVDLKQLAISFADDMADRLAQNLMSKVMDVVQKSILDSFAQGGQSVLTSVASGSDTLAKTGEDMGKVLTDSGSSILDFIKDGADSLMKAGKGIMDMIKSALSGGGGGIFGDILGGIGDAVGFLHTGSVIMAHTGLAAGFGSDERLIRGKVGEGMLGNAAMGSLDRQFPGSFAYLQRGKLPPAGGGSGGGGGNVININNHFPNQSQVEIDRFARKLAPALRRLEGRRVA